ncbi:MAG: hypothetical protein ACOX3T_00810 [Bdellovibrionota bacterium]
MASNEQTNNAQIEERGNYFSASFPAESNSVWGTCELFIFVFPLPREKTNPTYSKVPYLGKISGLLRRTEPLQDPILVGYQVANSANEETVRNTMMDLVANGHIASPHIAVADPLDLVVMVRVQGCIADQILGRSSETSKIEILYQGKLVNSNSKVIRGLQGTVYFQNADRKRFSLLI